MALPKIISIGGGLAGLSAGLVFAKNGIEVKLIEKKAYPFHRVCGEYISNEVWSFLESLGLFPNEWPVPFINRLEVTSVQGRILKQPLDLGGFGMSRYNLDQILSDAFIKMGGEIITETKINQVEYSDNQFYITDSLGKTYNADYVIGAYGKRSNLDQVLNRPFFRKRSPFLGVKYHLKFDLPKDLIQLHNFQGGYAGISAIENEKYCFCYLSQTENLKRHKTIPEMESMVLKKNPYIKNIFENGEFLWEKPLVIQEISFEPKELVFNHILIVILSIDVSLLDIGQILIE
jgi:flavin-dependent dehydrogenase